MMERVDVREWVEFQWPYLLAFLGGSERVRRLAYETGAFARPRKVDSPETLLQLLLMWAAAEQSLVDTAALAAEAGLADVSDVALLKRFAKAGDWLGALLGEILAERQTNLPRGLRVRLMDATTVSRGGATGTDHRVHVGMDLGTNHIDAFELTSAKGGETLERFAVRAGEIIIADAGYGHRPGLARVAKQGGFFVVRFAWSNVPLETEQGDPFDLLEALRTLPEAMPAEFSVAFRSPDGDLVKARLVAIRKSEPAAAATRERAMREARKHQRRVDVRTLEFAGFTFVLTNLPEETSAASVLELYRLRWQIEMKFKTLKSLLHLGDVPTRTDEGLRVYVLAKLLIAILIESLIDQAESFSPWGYPIPPAEHLENDAIPA